MKFVEPSAELVWATPNALQIIERSARICYKSEKKISSTVNESFIKSLIKRGHESVIEHAYASFHIICDRGISHNIVRHRIANYSQESTKFSNYTKDRFDNSITYIVPEDLTKEQIDNMLSVYGISEEIYMNLINKEGLKPEIARYILPNGLKTEIIMTCNFRV